jgi:two-component system sensor histidine kinase HydH
MNNSLKLILFFIILTLAATLVVVYAWEEFGMSPLYSYIRGMYPDDPDSAWRIAQRIEHICISVTVDALVVTLLLRLVDKQQHRLRESEGFLNTVLESSTEYAIIALDTEGRVTLFNRGAELIFGYKAAAMVGTLARALVRDERYDSSDKPFLTCGHEAEVKGRSQIEIEMMRADGTTFGAAVAITPIRKSESQLLGYLCIIRDLTVERQNEESLRHLREQLAHNEKIAALGRMAAQVAHEVRNPLSGLRLYSLHLKGKVEGKIGAVEMSLVDKIINSTNHLSDTVERVISFSRPLTLQRRTADLNRVVTDALQLVEPQLAANNVNVILNPGGDESGGSKESAAPIDEASMRSVLINLMLNSIQAMREGGEMTITTRRSADSVHIEIADTGIGMSEELLKNVFEPFYTTKSQGLGLGMYHVQKVIQLHGGSIKIESAVGGGTRVKIALPSEEKGAYEVRRHYSGGR